MKTKTIKTLLKVIAAITTAVLSVLGGSAMASCM